MCGEQVWFVSFINDVDQYCWSNYCNVKIGGIEVYSDMTDYEYETADC